MVTINVSEKTKKIFTKNKLKLSGEEGIPFSEDKFLKTILQAFEDIKVINIQRKNDK